MGSKAFEFRKIDDLIVVGKTEPVSIYEPLGPVDAVAEEVLRHRDRFEAALAAFQKGDWSRASTDFAKCGDDDPATETYRRRLAAIEENGAPDNWDGIWRLDSK